jgi:hypothetical protein
LEGTITDEFGIEAAIARVLVSLQSAPVDRGTEGRLTLMSSKNRPWRYGAVLFLVPDLVVISRVMFDWAAARPSSAVSARCTNDTMVKLWVKSSMPVHWMGGIYRYFQERKDR